MTEGDKSLLDRLQAEIDGWQTKLDEARVQMHLGAKEAQDEMKPYVHKLENELSQAKQQYERLRESSKGAWGDIEKGLNLSFNAMKEAFTSARKHFKEKQ